MRVYFQFIINNNHFPLFFILLLEDHSITLNGAGKILGNTRNNSPVATLNAGVYGLHMATFAQPLLRFALS